MRTRRRCLLTAALCISMGTAACADGGNSMASNDAESITLTWWQSDTRQDWVASRDHVIEDFEAANEGIDIEVEVMPWADMHTKVVAAAATNSLPDFILGSSNQPTGWAYAEITQPVEQIIQSIGADNLADATVNSLTIDGEAYGVPLFSTPHILWYRSDWFESAGIDPPRTWDDIFAAAEQLHNPENDRYGFLQYGKQPDSDNMIISIMGTHGSTTFTEDGDVSLDSQETVNALRTMKRLYGFSPDGSLSNSEDDARLQFAEGCCAMMITSTSFANTLTESPELLDMFSAVPVPSAQGDRGAYFSSLAFVVPQQTPPERVEAIQKFVEFWFTDDVMADWAANTVVGFVPTYTPLTESDTYWAAERVEPVADILRAGMQAQEVGVRPGETFGPNPCAATVDAEGVWGIMAERVITANDDPATVVHEAAAQVAELCNQ